jgi:Flp pilus assembly protein protease CpaA
MLIGLFFKIVGVVIVIAGYVIGQTLQSAFDIRQITTSNDFITAILHQDAVVALVEQAKQYVALGIIALSFGFGLLSFGIGMILGRLRKLAKQIETLSIRQGA